MPTLTHTPLVDILARLIRFPTVSTDTAANTAALDWVESQLQGLPLDIRRFENDGFPALIATTPAAGHLNPRLWLAGHIDVVPAAAADFEPRLEDGRLIGRGTFDMKYAIACFIRLLQELGPELANYDLGLMLTSDEEAGGLQGVRWLVDDLGYRGGAVLLPECGTSWTIEIAAKGTTCWQLRSRGLAGHASRPWNASNAIDNLMAFVDRLKTNVPAEPCGDDSHRHCTVSLGQISGGEAANQVPAHAEGLLDIRLAPGTSLDDVQDWMEAATRAVPGVEVSLVHGSAAIENPLEGPAAVFAAAVRDESGPELEPVMSHGASDGRYFNPYGIPVISVPPTGGGQHSGHEWIELASLEQYYAITRRFTQAWARVKR